MKKQFLLTVALIAAIIFISAGVAEKFDGQLTKREKKNILPPRLLSPVEGTYIPDSICSFTWSQTDTRHIYEIFISSHADFSEGVRDASKDTVFQYHIKALNADTVYWKVRAFKNHAQYSKWSTASYFIYGAEPVKVIKYPPPTRCNGDCAHCKHPCGRRAPPIDKNE